MSSLRPHILVSALVLTASACGAHQPSGPVQRAAAAQTASLQSRSGIACHQESECAVCYRERSCGEPIAASDPEAAAPACHVSPAPFCMARRAYCDEGHCVTR